MASISLTLRIANRRPRAHATMTMSDAQAAMMRPLRVIQRGIGIPAALRWDNATTIGAQIGYRMICCAVRPTVRYTKGGGNAQIERLRER